VNVVDSALLQAGDDNYLWTGQNSYMISAFLKQMCQCAVPSHTITNKHCQ